jgi:hypothetical protein
MIGDVVGDNTLVPTRKGEARLLAPQRVALGQRNLPNE